MPTPRPWTVLPHDSIQRHEDNLWTVEGRLEGSNPLRRRMTLIKRKDGALVIHNGQALEEAAMKEIEAWGEPRYLIVPNGFHRMDAHAYTQRYPKLQVFCPATEDAKVRQVVKVVVFVASDPGFSGQPAVANGISELLVQVFGDAGKHARSAVGVAVLPLDAPVEAEIVVRV